MQAYQLLINGKLVDGRTTRGIVNPATEEVFAQCPQADEALLDQAVASARNAFPGWSGRPLSERAGMLQRLADALEARRDDIALVLTQEQGKPLEDAKGEITGTAGYIRYIATLDLAPKVLKENASERIVQHRAPLGVVGAITPWNMPLILLAIKLAPGLLAGNTMIVKPAPTTPLTTLLVGELCAAIFPPGVVNTIADDNELGAVMTRHPDIAKIAFTGSTETGRKVMASAADTLKRLTLELGGNDAALVLDDNDPDAVAGHLLRGATLNCGQVCLAIKRAYVPEALYDAVCDALAQRAGAMVIGDGQDPSTQMGPIQNRAQYEKVKGYLDIAKRDGHVIAGGELPEGPGYFVPPTIVRDIDDSSLLVSEEQFGPILPVLVYRDVEDALARINDSHWGLGGTVWGRDLERAYALAQRFESGTVWVNRHLNLQAEIPFSGAKQSGIGTEYGQEGLEEFTQRKVINVQLEA
ncbi:aldehyde dehydrogenase family protein [Chromohalobacter canadensis]|uniref:aldehyde dehydrogenase family protein n=1 Tax=Chromohalobacter canadensis TaxID=141389 RepID=UPI0021BEF505|nr:aldehyde dehydrogenase family protein [Chromohalobacter canadensis]MCT8468818.1 aldehyde dehydrogenase family protein [Chromohalobacter canadensis]MCT8472992.1 aldehyde dehydrogenase family protein [Chromohalobacter canadensis]MCT8500444.1 aldehyde dehydrogenase family protein [Chromohalobacter canadensis]